MKRSALIVLTVLVALLAVLWLAGLVSAGRGERAFAPQAGAPTVVSYQGQIIVAGAAYSGTGYFKFAIVNQAGDTTYWSNDGTSSGGGEPTAAVTLTVTSGLFNVLLGDTTLPNMTALPATAFNGTERYLRVWFSSDNVTFTLLTPDRRIAAVPYALQAEEAKNAWSLTGNSGTTPGANFLGTSDAQPVDIRANGVEAMHIDIHGNVGVGTSDPGSKLDIQSSLNTVGTRFSLPAVSQLPDPSYTYDAVMQWKGGEAKFGTWRQYFNGWEQDWALTYNAPWDYTNNSWLGRDSGDPRANIAAMMRFNVAEGNSGLNVFEVGFAPPADAGVPPDWNAAAHYTFYDGRWSATSPMPARFSICGAADMDAVLTLSANSTYHPVRVNLTAVGTNPSEDLFKIQNADTGLDLLSIKTTSGNIGVGTEDPQSRFQVVGNYIQFPTITGSAPPAADCNEASEAGRVVVRTDGATNLYICTGAAGWVGK